MKVCGIVAEYNPFHNGHKFQIEKIKEETNADAIVAVMSGNFIQRGLPALFDKWTRTKMALLNGVDLVIELPTYYAVSSAEYSRIQANCKRCSRVILPKTPPPGISGPFFNAVSAGISKSDVTSESVNQGLSENSIAGEILYCSKTIMVFLPFFSSSRGIKSFC